MEFLLIALIHSNHSYIQEYYCNQSKQHYHKCVCLLISCHFKNNLSYHHHSKYKSEQIISKLESLISAVIKITGTHGTFHTFLCECCFILNCHQFLPV